MDALESFRGEAVEADAQMDQTRPNQLLTAFRGQQGGITDHLGVQARLAGFPNPAGDLAIEQRLAQELEVYIAHPEGPTIAQDLREQRRAHIALGALHLRVGAHGAAGIAPVGGFDMDERRLSAQPADAVSDPGSIKPLTRRATKEAAAAQGVVADVSCPALVPQPLTHGA